MNGTLHDFDEMEAQAKIIRSAERYVYKLMDYIAVKQKTELSDTAAKAFRAAALALSHLAVLEQQLIKLQEEQFDE